MVHTTLVFRPHLTANSKVPFKYVLLEGLRDNGDALARVSSPFGGRGGPALPRQLLLGPRGELLDFLQDPPHAGGLRVPTLPKKAKKKINKEFLLVVFDNDANEVGVSATRFPPHVSRHDGRIGDRYGVCGGGALLGLA